MNNTEQIKNFILKKLNDCFLCTHKNYPNRISQRESENGLFHIYDKQLLRIKKLQRLSNQNEITFKPGQNSIVMFVQDYDNGYFWYNDENVCQFLKNKYNIKHKEINNIIKCILLNNDNKIKNLIPWVDLAYRVDLNENNYKLYIHQRN